MFRKLALSVCFSVSCVAVSTAAFAAETAAAPAAYTTAATDIGTLIDNTETKAILDKHMPGFADNPQIAMARAMTLKQIQGFAADQITDEKLSAIDADLAKLPVRK